MSPENSLGIEEASIHTHLRPGLLCIWLVFMHGGYSAAFAQEAGSSPCGSESSIIQIFAEPEIGNQTYPGLGEDLTKQLKTLLRPFGYCVLDSVAEAPEFDENIDAGANSWILLIRGHADSASVTRLPETQGFEGPKDSSPPAEPSPIALRSKVILKAALVRPKEIQAIDRETLFRRPLALLSVHREEIRFSVKVFAQKIAETLAETYVCHVTILTDPQRVRISTLRGLEGESPVEWVLPIGSLQVKAEVPGYLPFSRTLKFGSPGAHHFQLELTKRRFYHSGWIYPAAVSLIAAGTAYYMQNAYWEDYLALGENDLVEDPDRFQRTFRKARYAEQATVGALAAALAFLGFSFAF